VTPENIELLLTEWELGDDPRVTWNSAELAKHIRALRADRDRLAAVVATCHLAVGEAPESDDETLPEGIRLRMQDRERLAAELEHARRVIVRLMDPSGLGAMDEARAYLAEREKEKT
jgi:hypothetical protein